MSMPFCFLGIYGLYRFTPDEWQAAFNRFWERTTRFFTVGVANTLDRMSTSKKLILGTAMSVALALFAQSGGPLFIVDLGFFVAQYALVYVGFTAFFKDAKTWLRTPISNVFTNFGKILGTLWGRWLSYEIFTGTITGSLGPAIGQVRSQGVISAVIPSILSPRSGWFALNSGYASILMSRVATLFNSVISGLFFSHNMRLWGDFQGYVGPNSFQVFTLMIIGGLIGYSAEKFVDALYQSLKDDGLELMEKAVPHVQATKNQAYQMRWHLAYVAMMTPIVLASPAAASILAVTGGSVLGAVVFTASAAALALASVYGAGYGLRQLIRRIMPEHAAAPDRAFPALQAAALPSSKPSLSEEAALLLPPSPPVITPAFAAALEAADVTVSGVEPAPTPILVEGDPINAARLNL